MGVQHQLIQIPKNYTSSLVVSIEKFSDQNLVSFNRKIILNLKKKKNVVSECSLVVSKIFCLHGLHAGTFNTEFC